MYLKIDLLSPLLAEFTSTNSTRAIFLENFPTTVVDSIEVFGELEIYDGSVIQTNAAKNIYRLLNTSVEDLENQKYKGIKSVWFEMVPYFDDTDTLTQSEVATFINNWSLLSPVNTPITDKITGDITYVDIDEWYDIPIEFDNSSTVSLSDTYGYIDQPSGVAISNATIISMLESSDINFNLFGFNNDISKLTAMVLLDSSEDIFERRFEVVSRETTGTLSTKPGTKATVIMSFKRKVVASTQTIITTIINNIPEIEDDKEHSFGKNLYTAYTKIKPIASAGLFYNKVIGTELDENENTVNIYKGYLRVSETTALMANDFGVVFSQAIGSDYEKKRVDWWVDYVNMAIIVITVVAIALSIPTGGSSAVVWGQFLATASLYAGLGYLSQTILMKHFNDSGQYSNAIQTGGSSVFLQNISTTLGYLSLLTGGWTSIKDWVKLGLVKSIEFSIQMFNMAFSVYRTQIEPPDKDLDKKQNQINKQVTLLEDFTSPKAMALIQYNFESYTWLDINEQMDNMPYLMTQGRIDNATTKYY